ncbi:MAG: peptide ABC transporter substrate-binding protein [Roseiflexaceae bacterium]|nr:peptide ABC transporter substrate-binding protein [Roseiflexaceae bacterium]
MHLCRVMTGRLLMAFVLTACVAAPVVPTVAPTAAPAASAAVIRAGAPADTLRWSIEGVSDLASLDPAKAGDNPTVTVVNLIFGGLLRLNESLEVQPNDAASWVVSEDGKTYTFTLREGLVFADGTAVTAADYVFSINRAIQPETGSFIAPGQFSGIRGAQQVISGSADMASGLRSLDDRTLQIELVAPSAAFLQLLTFPSTAVVPRQLSAQDGWAEQQPFGTGPYVVKSWTRGESILLAANERYWQGKPGVPLINISFSSESATAYERYLAGQLDIMGSLQNPLPASMLPAVAGLPDFRTSASLNTRYIGFNNLLPPFNSDDARRAFALAVDRFAIANQVLGGEAIAAERILPPQMIGTRLPIRPIVFDPDAARAALEQAGFSSGAALPPITLTYAPEGGENELVIQALQQGWKQYLDVDVVLQAVDATQLGELMTQTRKTPEQGLQMYYSVWGADYADPQNFISQQLHSGSPNNNGHFSDSRFDRLVEEADQIGARSDIQRRLLLYNQAEQIAIDRVGWLPILHSKVHMLLHPRVQGLVVTPNGTVVPDWSKLRLSE